MCRTILRTLIRWMVNLDLSLCERCGKQGVLIDTGYKLGERSIPPSVTWTKMLSMMPTTHTAKCPSQDEIGATNSVAYQARKPGGIPEGATCASLTMVSSCPAQRVNKLFVVLNNDSRRTRLKMSDSRARSSSSSFSLWFISMCKRRASSFDIPVVAIPALETGLDPLASACSI